MLLINQAPAAAFDRPRAGSGAAAIDLLPPFQPRAIAPPATPEPSFELTLRWPDNDRLADLMSQAGIPRAEAQAAEARVRAHFAQGVPAGSDVKLKLALDPASRRRLLELTVLTDHGDLSFAADGAKLGPSAAGDRLRRHKLRLDENAYWSLRALGVGGEPAQALLAHARRAPHGPALSVVIGERSDRFGQARTKVLLYAAAGGDGRETEWLRRPGPSGEWVQVSRSAAPSWEGLMQPTDGRVSSHFGMRSHPILGYARFHRGVDFAASWGTPVRAAADGEVAAAEWRGGYGRQVRIVHSGRLSTSYSHLAEMRVAPGQQVRRGQLIGFVGASGLATGPHLHFEVFEGGRAIDPMHSAKIDHSAHNAAASALLERYRQVARG